MSEFISKEQAAINAAEYEAKIRADTIRVVDYFNSLAPGVNPSYSELSTATGIGISQLASIMVGRVTIVPNGNNFKVRLTNPDASRKTTEQSIAAYKAEQSHAQRGLHS